MTLDQLRCYCAVADHGTFAAAAEALGLTQPALSMQIARLEDELGLTLLLKTGRRKVPGAEGLVILARARRVLAELGGLTDEASSLRGLASGTLALAAGDTVIRHLLAADLAAFAREWPGVHLHAWNRTSTETLALVRDGRADLGFLTLPVDAPDLEVRPWRRFRWVVAAPPGDLPPAPASLVSLNGRTLVVLEPGTRLHEVLARAREASGLGRGPTVEAGSTDIQLDLAARGLGIAVVPDFALVGRSDLEAQTLEDGEPGALVVVCRPGPLPRAAAEFRNRLFSNRPGPGTLKP